MMLCGPKTVEVVKCQYSLRSQFCLHCVHSDHVVSLQSTGQGFEQAWLAGGFPPEVPPRAARCRHFHSATTDTPAQQGKKLWNFC